MTNTLELDRRAILGVLGVLGGAAIAATGARIRSPSKTSNAVALWLADRDADILVGLNAELERRVAIQITCPVAVEPGRAGGAWVLSAPRRTGADGRRRLHSVEPDGTRQLIADLNDSIAMRTGADGSAWVLMRRGKSLVRFTSREGSTEFELPERCRALAVHSNGDLLAATRSGGLVSGGLRGGWDRAVCLERFPLDVAPHPDGWWVLARDRIVQLDRQLRVRYAVALRDEPGRLVDAGGGSECGAASRAVWHLSADRLQRIAPGEPRVVAARWPLSGVCAAAVFGSQSVVVAPGAVMTFDGRGRARAGQGGFRRLVDVAAARYEPAA